MNKVTRKNPSNKIDHDRIKYNKDIIIYFLSILMGVVGGLAATLLKLMIEFSNYIFLEVLLPILTIKIFDLNLGYIFLAGIGGLIVGLLIEKIAPETKGSGIPQVLESSILKGGRIRSRAGILKTIVTSITIGSGGSAGKEGPVAFVGAATGSILGEKLHLKLKEKRLLMTCGLAAGISGMFDAPLGGAIFALEVLFQGVTLIGAIPVFISSVIGSAINGAFFGHNPIFVIEYSHTMINPFEYILFVILGCIFALIGFIITRFHYFIVDSFSKLETPAFLKPTIGGLIAGLIIMINPTSGFYGIGLDGIQLALYKNYSIFILLLLGILKLLATSFTLGSGGSGGVFGPLLFIGCMFGGFFGESLHLLFPDFVKFSNVYYLIGMAALFASMAQAPLNVSIIIIELTENFSLLPPLIITSVASYFISGFLFKGTSFYTYKLEYSGMKIKADTIFYLENISVNEIMTEQVVSISPDASVSDLVTMSNEYEYHNFPVVNLDGVTEGEINLKNALKIPFLDWENYKIKDIMKKDFQYVVPSDKISKALDLMQENKLRFLIVVDKIIDDNNQERKIMRGVLGLKDILKRRNLNQ